MGKYYKLLGPGLLAAGAAIGVSHLVQSTKAGAEFGYQLLWVVFAANLIKYPFFAMAPKYTAATGESLLAGYAKLGKWPLFVVFLMTIATMFTIQAAVTIVTAGIAIEIFGLPFDAKMVSLFLLVICSVVLAAGRYSILDNLIKWIIIILAITTIASVFGGISKYDGSGLTEKVFDWGDKAHLFFLVGLAGWMPAPLDLSVWHSVWMEEKGRVQGQKMDLKTAMLDFRVGYIGTVFLAVCFVILGALVMYGRGYELSPSAGGFAKQLIQLYTGALGSWAYMIIGVAALTTMLSTTLTCFDAFPRVLRETGTHIFGGEKGSRKNYLIWLSIVGIGTMVFLFGFIENMGQMVAIATTLSFVLAPVYAILNYLLMRSEGMPEEVQVKGANLWICRLFILVLILFSLWFIWLKYISQ